MPLRIAITAEPIPSHVSALDYVTGPVLEQGHDATLYAPLMFRRKARRRGVEFREAGTGWTCVPAVEQTASTIWKGFGNGLFNQYVFGQLWPDQAETKACDLITAWTRTRPDLVIAECSDFGAHLAARVLQLPILAADNDLGPVLLDLWDTDIAPALTPLYKQYEQDALVLPDMPTPAPAHWFYATPPPRAHELRRTVAEHRTALPNGWTTPPPTAPLSTRVSAP